MLEQLNIDADKELNQRRDEGGHLRSSKGLISSIPYVGGPLIGAWEGYQNARGNLMKD
ncbi:hypothetical protein [Parachlamydia acanthamoebae]|uniref:hypothetical protein n=1 Tax=Parachlamydia acanthamoebae TaxID=83552 RepID=UPI0001C17A29|nr:hypothetical protein [Parachlamydia acanthamoebae]EFB42421.1 hypothetical protein pah_c008o031 [Parachlamydia acanthamoebae str. Hall's coccus]